jgi:hypothetical protein
VDNFHRYPEMRFTHGNGILKKYSMVLTITVPL